MSLTISQINAVIEAVKLSGCSSVALTVAVQKLEHDKAHIQRHQKRRKDRIAREKKKAAEAAYDGGR